MLLTVTKRFEFAYAHYLPDYPGDCARLHGHNAILEVEVASRAKAYPTMVVDFKDLKTVVKEKVLSKLDHEYLNDILHYPTAESMAEWVWEQLEDDLELVRVRVYETSDSYAELKK